MFQQALDELGQTQLLLLVSSLRPELPEWPGPDGPEEVGLLARVGRPQLCFTDPVWPDRGGRSSRGCRTGEVGGEPLQACSYTTGARLLE